MSHTDFPGIYPHQIYIEGFQYIGSASLPASDTLPSQWHSTPDGQFTTKDGMVMQCLGAGELILSTPLSSYQLRNPKSKPNYGIFWTTIGRENMIFEIRARRVDENNYVSMEIDSINNVIKIKQKISGSENTLASTNYNIVHEILTVYEFGFIMLNDHLSARINGNQVLTADCQLFDAHGTSINVPSVFEEDPIAFSALNIYETYEYNQPQLNNDNLIVLFREMIKNNIECKNDRTWNTFKRAKKLYDLYKNFGFSDRTWTHFGFPIEEPKSETWFGNE